MVRPLKTFPFPQPVTGLRENIPLMRGMKMTTENQTFAEKFDLLGCIQCGRCTGGCPVTVRTNLNVRRFVYDAYNEELLDELSRLSLIHI